MFIISHGWLVGQRVPLREAERWLTGITTPAKQEGIRAELVYLKFQNILSWCFHVRTMPVHKKTSGVRLWCVQTSASWQIIELSIQFCLMLGTRAPCHEISMDPVNATGNILHSGREKSWLTMDVTGKVKRSHMPPASMTWNQPLSEPSCWLVPSSRMRLTWMLAIVTGALGRWLHGGRCCYVKLIPLRGVYFCAVEHEDIKPNLVQRAWFH